MSPPKDPLRSDIRNLLYVVWRHLGLPDPTRLQYDMALYAATGPDRSMIQAFRGAAKSWCAAVVALHCLLNNPHANVVIVSASKSRADAFTIFMLRLINEIPALQHLRPREGQRQSALAFDVGPARASQAPSVFSIGIGGMMTGSRADLLIADDIEVTNNSETLQQREKLAEKIKEFAALLKPGGKILYLGTPQTEDTIYRQLPERGYEIRIWPAQYPDPAQEAAYEGRLAPLLQDDLRRDAALAGQPVEPTRFPMMELDKKRLEYGKAGYALQFMLDPRLSDEDLYPLKLKDLMVLALDPMSGPQKVIWSSLPERVINDAPMTGMRGDRWMRALVVPNTPYVPYDGVVMAIDPAGRGRDETGYAVVAALNGVLYVLDAGGLKGYDRATMVELAKTAKRWRVNHVIVEPNFGDGMFKALLEPVMAEIHRCVIEESERSNAQKERRIADTLEPVIADHRMVVNEALVFSDYKSCAHLPVEQQNQYRLWYQLTHLTRDKGSLKHDDRLDALALAVGYWQASVSQDISQAVERTRQKALDDELRKFSRSVFGHKKKSLSYIKR